MDVESTPSGQEADLNAGDNSTRCHRVTAISCRKAGVGEESSMDLDFTILTVAWVVVVVAGLVVGLRRQARMNNRMHHARHAAGAYPPQQPGVYPPQQQAGGYPPIAPGASYPLQPQQVGFPMGSVDAPPPSYNTVAKELSRESEL